METTEKVTRIGKRLGVVASALLCSLAWLTPAAAQSTVNSGFSVNRYEPTAAGEWSFWVDHPWYSSLRYFAGGITLNYGHNPLVFGRADANGGFTQTSSVIEHQLLGHVDLAGSFLDRVLITATLPVTFLERGTPAAGVTPTDGVVVGDPRLGAWVRLFGQPYSSAISMSLGASVWLPLRGLGATSGVSSTSSESGVRVLPKLALGGLTHHVMWSFTGGFLYRPAARIGVGVDDSGSTVGSELQLGAAIAYADTDRRLAIGPEAVLSTVLLGTDAVKPFSRDFTSLEVLLGVHYNIARIIQLGVGGGVGLLRTPGTPDGRVLLRLAYAPWGRAQKPVEDPDHDGDGIPDRLDICPDAPMGRFPDPLHLGCPLGDRDGDGVLDPNDLCPDVPKGSRPDTTRLGCPLGDRDGDTVLDPDDLCPDEPKGPKPDPNRLGCPAGDRDKDGVLDPDDLCPDVHKGNKPDPNRLGCPVGDRDHDTVVDTEDACPDQPGAPNLDAKKNGCPGLVEVKNGQLVIIKPVFFATNKDVILAKSFPVLTAVADALKASPELKKIAIEGHTDNKGKPAHNLDLSDRRAKSVMKWLMEEGKIDGGRLQSKGYGPERPIADNKTNAGREKNRRVDFVIIDPPQSNTVKTEDPAKAVVPASPDQSDHGSGKKHHRKSRHAK